MPNVNFTQIVSATSTPGNFDASPVSANFNIVRSVMNTQYYGLDSINYASDSAGFASQHIRAGQIGSQHFTDGAIAVSNISQSALESRHLNFMSSDAGIMAAQAGAISSQFLPYLCRCVFTWVPTAATNNTIFTIVYSDNATDGYMSLTGTPIPAGGPVVSNAQSSCSNAISQYGIVSMNTSACQLKVNFSQTVTSTVTVHMAFMLANG